MYNACWGNVFIGCVPGRKKQDQNIGLFTNRQLIFVSPLKI